jgi:hypothetical protein
MYQNSPPSSSDHTSISMFIIMFVQTIDICVYVCVFWYVHDGIQVHTEVARVYYDNTFFNLFLDRCFSIFMMNGEVLHFRCGNVRDCDQWVNKLKNIREVCGFIACLILTRVL